MKKRILSMLLLVAMLVTMIPVAASAEEAQNAATTSATDYDYHDKYVTDGLIGLFTAFDANDASVSLRNGAGTWTNRVSGKPNATFSGKDWEKYANGGIGYKYVYGTIGEDGFYSATNTGNRDNFNNLNKLVFGLDLLPKEDYTLEYVALYTPMYAWNVKTSTYVKAHDYKTSSGEAPKGQYSERVVDMIGITHTFDCYRGGVFDGGIGHARWRVAPKDVWTGADLGLNWGATTELKNLYGFGYDTTRDRNTGEVATYTVIHDRLADTTQTVDGVETPVYKANFYNYYNGANARYAGTTAGTNAMDYRTHSSATTDKQFMYYNTGADTDFYLSQSTGTDFYAVRIYDRVLSADEREYNRMIDVLEWYNLKADAAFFKNSAKVNKLAAVAAAASFETDAVKRAAKATELQALIDAPLFDDIKEHYVQEGLVELYSVYGTNNGLDLANGKWTGLVGGNVATFNNKANWSVNANGSVGFTSFCGVIVDGAYAKSGTGNNNNYNKGNRLVFDMSLLSNTDFTVEYMAMYKPLYVYDAAQKDKIAKNADGSKMETFSQDPATTGLFVDKGDVDKFGWFSSIAAAIDGQIYSAWAANTTPEQTRGASYWVFGFNYGDSSAWYADTSARQGWWLGGKSRTAAGGLHILSNPYNTNDKVRTYAVTVDETVTASGDTEALFSLYRDTSLYNSNASTINSTAKTGGAAYYDKDFDSTCRFWLANNRPVDFFGVRIYDEALTSSELMINRLVDLILFYNLTLPANILEDAELFKALATAVSGVAFATDEIEKAAAELQINDAITFTSTSAKLYGMYVQQDLVANFTALSPIDATASIENGAWANRVEGGSSATFGNAKFWHKNVNGSVGFNIFYGSVDATGAYSKDGAYNNYTTLGTKLDLGIATLPKNDFTVEFVAQINPVYAADKDGKPAGEAYLLNGNTPGSQQYQASVFQLGYLGGWTTNINGVHTNNAAYTRNALAWAIGGSYTWGGDCGYSRMDCQTAPIKDSFLAQGSVHTYAITRDEHADAAVEDFVAVNYALLRDTATHSTFAVDSTTKAGNSNWIRPDFSQDDKGTFALSHRLSTDFYAVRVYSRVLTSAELAQNHMVDIVAYYGLTLDDAVYTDADLRAQVATILLPALIVNDAATKAANRIAYQALVDEAVAIATAKSVYDYDSLYVQSGLVGLYTAFVGDRSMDMVEGVWANKMTESGYGNATFRGANYWNRKLNGVKYDLTLAQYKEYGSNVGIDLDAEFAKLDNFTVEAFALVMGLTNADGSRLVNRYIPASTDEEGNTIPATGAEYNYFKSHVSAFRFDLLTAIFFAAADVSVNQSLTARWWLMDHAYAGSNPAADEAVNLTMHEGGWRDMGSLAEPLPGVMQVVKKTTKTSGTISSVYYGIGYNGVDPKVEKEIDNATLTQLLSKPETDAAGRMSLFNSVASTVYAIRVYNRELRIAEKIQNAFVDKAAYYQIDLTGFEKLDSTKKEAIYQLFATLDYSLTKDQVQAIYNFNVSGDFKALTETTVTFDKYEPILSGANGYRALFELSKSNYDILVESGYTVTFGVLVAPGGSHNSVSNVTVGKSGVKNIVVGGANGSGIYYNAAGAKGYFFSAAVTSENVANFGADMIVRAYITVSKNGTTYTAYDNAEQNDVLDGEVSILDAADYFVNEFDGDVALQYKYNNSAVLRDILKAYGYTARKAVVADDLVLYVDVEKGNDANNGTSAKPYKTLGAAFAAAKAHLAQTGRKTVTMYLASGEYVVTEQLVIDGKDILADEYSFTVIGAGESTVITSEVEINYDRDDVPEDLYGSYVQLPLVNGAYPEFRAVYADGQLLDIVSYGSSENLTKILDFYIEDPSGNVIRDFEVDEKTGKAQNDWGLVSGLPYATYFGVYKLPAEMFENADLEDYAGTELFINYVWEAGVCHIDHVEIEGDYAYAYVPYCEVPHPNVGHNQKGQVCWIMNSKGLLGVTDDTYYYDQENGKLYYYGYEYELYDFEKLTYASLDRIFVLNDAENIAFIDLNFTGIDNKYITSTNGVNWGQAASATKYYAAGGTGSIGFMENAAISGNNVNGLFVQNVNVRDTLSSGIVVKNTAKNIVIDSSSFTNLGGSAVQMGGGTSGTLKYVNNLVFTNNYASNIGTVAKASVAFHFTHVANAKIVGNTVASVPYSAFSLGWRWGDPASTADQIVYGADYTLFNVEVAYNYVTDIMLCMGDGGAFYLNGAAVHRNHKDSTSYNYLHHNYVVMSKESGLRLGNENGWRNVYCYYFENSTSNWLSEYNVLVNEVNTVSAYTNATFLGVYLQTYEGGEARNITMKNNYYVGFNSIAKIYNNNAYNPDPEFNQSAQDYVFKSVANLASNTGLTGKYNNAQAITPAANSGKAVAGIFHAAGSTLDTTLKTSALNATLDANPAATRTVRMDAEFAGDTVFSGTTVRTVTFTDGKTTAKTYGLAGTALKIPAEFRQDGYEYDFKVGGQLIDTKTYVLPASNVTVNVSEKLQTYTITFVGAIGSPVIEVAIGEGFKIPASVLVEGKIVTLTYDGTEVDPATFKMPAQDIEIRVTYADPTYTVTFKSETKEQTFTAKAGALVMIDKNAFAITGKTTKYMYDGAEIDINTFTVPAKDIVVNVTYVDTIYTIKFLDAQNNVLSEQKLKYGEMIAVPTVELKDFEKDGFRYEYELGWHTGTGNAQVEFVEGTTATTNLTIYANYTKTEIPAYAVGDVDGNGSITVLDVIAVVSAASGETLDPAKYPGNADIDNNGSVTVLDVIKVVELASAK